MSFFFDHSSKIDGAEHPSHIGTRTSVGRILLPAALIVLASLSACGGSDDIAFEDGQGMTLSSAPENEDSSFFGTGLGGSGEVRAPRQAGSNGVMKVGVNIYLWRAALDALAFMPMLDSDAYGGVIITDWYADPSAPTERFKVTAYVLDGRLRADGLKVTVFKQAFQPNGMWVDATVSPDTITKLEHAILTRARQIRIAELGE